MVWSVHVEMHFVFLLARNRFGQHILRYIWFPRWHWMRLVNTCRGGSCVLADMKGVFSTHAEIHSVFADKGGFWSTLVEMHFVASMAWVGIGQHMVKCIFVLNILCSRWHMRVWSTNVEMHIMYSLA